MKDFDDEIFYHNKLIKEIEKLLHQNNELRNEYRCAYVRRQLIGRQERMSHIYTKDERISMHFELCDQMTALSINIAEIGGKMGQLAFESTVLKEDVIPDEFHSELLPLPEYPFSCRRTLDHPDVKKYRERNEA